MQVNCLMLSLVLWFTGTSFQSDMIIFLSHIDETLLQMGVYINQGMYI